MTLPSDYLESVKLEIFNIKQSLREGNLVRAYEALLQAEQQINYSLDEIKKVKV